MIGVQRSRIAQLGRGRVWPHSGNGTPGAIGDRYGIRRFLSAHPPYNRDFHRGCDLSIGCAVGTPIYSTIDGKVNRRYQTHFDVWDSDLLADWQEVDAGAALAPSISGEHLRLTCTRNAITSWPATAARLENIRSGALLNPKEDDWFLRMTFASAPSLTEGAVGFGIYDADNDQYATLEYDGTTITARCKTAGGVLAVDADTAAAAGKVWLRLFYDLSADTLYWQHSADGTTWVTALSQAGISWTKGGGDYPAMRAVQYWVSAAASGADQVVDVDYLGWFDGTGIGRFGNWMQVVGQPVAEGQFEKWVFMHFDKIVVQHGDHVHAGQLLGYAGKTGFDEYSGLILSRHIHFERIENNERDYSNEHAMNPLKPGILPRTNVSNNVSVVEGIGTEPYTSTPLCIKYSITELRADQDFDFNRMEFVGSLASRTLDWDLRLGMDPSNSDTPFYEGVFVDCGAFNEESASYTLDIYLAPLVVGTRTSVIFKDSAGGVLVEIP